MGQSGVSDQNCSQEISVINSSSCPLSIYIQYLDQSFELEYFGDLEAGDARTLPIKRDDVFVYAVNDINQQVASALSVNCESMDLVVASCFVESSNYFDCENLKINSKRENTSPRPVESAAFASCGDEFEFEIDSDEDGIVLWTTPSEEKSVTFDDHFFYVSDQLDQSMSGLYLIEWFGFNGCYERTEVMLEIANCCSLRNEFPQDTVICNSESLIINPTLANPNSCREEINGFAEAMVKAEGNVTDVEMFEGEADQYGPRLHREMTTRETYLLLDLGELIPDNSEICFLLRQGTCTDEYNSSNFELSAGGRTFSLKDSDRFMDVNLTTEFQEFCIKTTEETRYVKIEDLGNGCGIRLDAVEWKNTVLISQFEYLWNTGETTKSIEVNRPGLYSLKVTSCNGCLAYNEVIVGVESCEEEVDETDNENETPQEETPCNESFSSPVTSSDTFQSCFGETTITGNVALNDSDPDGYQLQWDLFTEAINGKIDMSSDGNFTYTPNAQFSGIDQFQYRVCKQKFEPCDDANIQFQCAIGSVTIEITNNQFSFPQSEIRACQGETVILNVPDNLEVLWSTGSTFNSISVVQSGRYRATVTDGNGCLVSDELEVIFDTSPEVNISKSNDIDCSADIALLTASEADSYVWNNGQTDQTIAVNQPGVYQVTALSNEGCSSFASVQVEENIINVTAVISGSSNVCSIDESVVLSAFGGDTYLWSTGETNQSITVEGPGIYAVTATDNETGCISSTSREIDLIPVVALAGPDVTICLGETIAIGANQVGPTNGSFSWNNGASGIINSNSTGRIAVSPTQTQTYTLEVINNGCLAIDQVTVFVEDFSFETSNNQTICQGESIVLSAKGAFSYVWSTGETNPEITVTPDQSQIYSVIGVNEAGCSTERSISVGINDPVSTSITPNQIICAGETITIGATGGSVYEWSNGAIGSSITISPDASTNYTVTITNNFGCQTTESTNVNIQSLESINLGPDREVCSNEQFQLGAPKADSYLWSTGETTQVIDVLPTQSQSYAVTISQGGCSAEDDVFIEVINCLGNISGFVFDDLNEGLSLSSISLYDSGRNVINKTSTNDDGFYQFTSLVPGNYFVEQVDIASYISVSDFDETSDDLNDVDGVNNTILVTLEVGENDADNNFRDQIINGLISGFAFNADGAGLQNTTISLYDTNDNLLSATITNSDGYYQFSPLSAGDYIVEQADLLGYSNLSDEDETPDDVGDVDLANNQIFVSIGSRESDTDNNFRDQLVNGSISGSALDELGNGIGNIVITLRDLTGTVISSVATNINGFYEFSVVASGDYILEQVDIPGYLNLSDFDESSDDPNDVDEANNNIFVSVEPNEHDADNIFRDQLVSGLISGFAFDDQNNGISNVTISLYNSNRNLIAVQTTTPAGFYEFASLRPGDYIIEQGDIVGFDNISDFDESTDDPNDVDEANNIIFATVEAQENDTDNNFRDQLSNGSISGFALDQAGNGLANIRITLRNLTGATVSSVATNTVGYYEFSRVVVGDYILVQVDIPGYENISDFDESSEDVNDVDEANNNIFVSVEPNEVDADNIFRDQFVRGLISGFALDGQNNGLANITISLLNTNQNLIATRLTNAIGFYEFASLEPGDYIIAQDDIDGFENVSDFDESSDDVNDVDDANNIIFATIETQESDTDNNFRDQIISEEIITGSISGFSLIDVNDDGTGDTPFSGTSIFLLDANGNQIQTAKADQDGQYSFEDLAIGQYTLLEEVVDGYGDVSDKDETTSASDQDGLDDPLDNRIQVVVSKNENDTGNNFVNRLLISRISGFVRIDLDADGSLDAPLENISIDLFNGSGVRQARTETDENGYFEFVGFEPGTYFLFEDQEEGIYQDLFDRDESTSDFDLDGFDNVVNNQIVVILAEGEHDADNNFANFIPNVGTIAGFVLEDINNDDEGDQGLEGILVSLYDLQNSIVSTKRTANDGSFEFTDIAPGDYYLSETDRVGFDDVSDFDNTDSDDSNDIDGVNDVIYVSIEKDEVDDGNIFVNRRSQSEIIETCRQAQFDDFSLGFGDFWLDGGSNVRFSQNDVFLSAPGAIEISNDLGVESSIFSSTQNFESVNSIQININYMVLRAETTDHWIFEVSNNGGQSFTEVRRWQINVDFINQEWNFTSVSVPGDMLSSTTVLRIRSELSSAAENLFLDDIEIEICFDEVDDNDDGVALTSNNDPSQTVAIDNSAKRQFAIDQASVDSVEKVEATQASTYTLFPNPASDYINIQLPSDSDEKVSIILYSSSGQQIYKGQMQPNQSQIRLDVQQLGSDQLYFIQIQNDDKEMQMLRFLKIN